MAIKLRRRFGFWAAVRAVGWRGLVAPEAILGVVVGAGLAVFLGVVEERSDRFNVAGDFLALTSALLGVVFAGFALVISFMSDHYLRVLEKTEGGTLRFLRPFMVATGLQVGALILAIMYRATSASLPVVVEPWVFGVVSTLFAVAVFDVVALARSVLMHGVARAVVAKLEDEGSSGS